MTDATNTHLVIHRITLLEAGSNIHLEKNVPYNPNVPSDSYDRYLTEQIISQVKGVMWPGCRLLLWLNVGIIIGNKRVRLTQNGGGIPIWDTESFEYVLEKLKELGKRVIGTGKESAFFANKQVSPPYLRWKEIIK